MRSRRRGNGSSTAFMVTRSSIPGSMSTSMAASRARAKRKLADGDALDRDRPGLDRVARDGPRHGGRRLDRGRNAGGFGRGEDRERGPPEAVPCKPVARESTMAAPAPSPGPARASARVVSDSCRPCPGSAFTVPEFCERTDGPEQGGLARLSRDIGPTFVGIGALGRRQSPRFTWPQYFPDVLLRTPICSR